MRHINDPDDFDPNVVHETLKWTREYAKQCGESNLLRFSIGVYQIHQMLQWGRGKLDSAESACAMTIHVAGAAEMVGCDLTASLPPQFSTCSHGYENEILEALTGAMQQHVYILRLSQGKYSEMRSRKIDRGKLGFCSGIMIKFALAGLGVDAIRSGFEAASSVLVKQCWRLEK